VIKRIINFFYFTKSFYKKLEIANKILEQNNSCEKIYEIKQKLQNLQYHDNKIDNIFADYDLDLNLSLKQFIYSKFINTPYFTSRLMFSLAYHEKFYFPIPKIYLETISKFTKVSFFKSKILFNSCIFFFSIYQILFIIKHLIYFFTKKKKLKTKIFLDSVPDLYSDTQNEKHNLDFFKWAINYFRLDKNKVYFTHNNKLIKNKNVTALDVNYETIYFQNSFINSLELIYLNFYLKSFFKIFPLIIKNIINFQLEFLFLIKEIFFFFYFKNLPKESFYNYCLFNNSGMVFRPLWTYVNEKKNKGSVILYFYSTNMMPLMQEINKKKYFDVYGYSLHSWPAYITWHKNQKKWLKNIINYDAKFLPKTLVPFMGRHTKLIKKKKTLTIFDVPPKRLEIYNLLNNSYNIYTFEYCQKFIIDIINSIPKNLYTRIEVILKLKKDYDNISPKYKSLISSLVNSKKIKLIKDISPESVVEISDATISIPFTSTAIISFNRNKKTIYYDPSGKLKKNYSIEKRIKLISSKKNLQMWMTNFLK